MNAATEMAKPPLERRVRLPDGRVLTLRELVREMLDEALRARGSR